MKKIFIFILILFCFLGCSKYGDQDIKISAPILIGGSNNDDGRGIGVDRLGNIYICGNTISEDFPLGNPIDSSFNGRPNDIFITKLTLTGDSILYSTYIGGSLRDECKAFAVDADGNAYITGRTNSPDFPVTDNAFSKKAPVTYDIIAVKISPEGKLVYSAIFGGESMEEARGIAIDKDGNCIIAGGTHSSDFPTTTGSYCPKYTDVHEPDPLKLTGKPFTAEQAFVAKINPDGTKMEYCTFIGGTGHDKVWCADVDDMGRAIVAGHTRCEDFPVTENAIQKNLQGNQDAFVAMLSQDGSRLEYGSYFGGSGEDKATGVGIDDNGKIWLAGNTNSDDLLLLNPKQDKFGGGKSDIFILKIDPITANIEFSSYCGGDAEDEIASDALFKIGGKIIIAGNTRSMNFPAEINSDLKNIQKLPIIIKIDNRNNIVLSFLLPGMDNAVAKAVTALPTGHCFIVGSKDNDIFVVSEK